MKVLNVAKWQCGKVARAEPRSAYLTTIRQAVPHISLGCLVRFAAILGDIRANAFHYIVQSIGTRYGRHRDEAWKASEQHLNPNWIQFAQFVLKIAPIRGSKFGIGRKMLYLCSVNPERHKSGKRSPGVDGRKNLILRKTKKGKNYESEI